MKRNKRNETFVEHMQIRVSTNEEEGMNGVSVLPDKAGAASYLSFQLPDFFLSFLGS